MRGRQRHEPPREDPGGSTYQRWLGKQGESIWDTLCRCTQYSWMEQSHFLYSGGTNIGAIPAILGFTRVPVGTSGLTVIWCQRFAFTPCELRQRRGLLAGWNAHEPRGECAQPSRHLAALRKPSFRTQMFNGTRNRTHRFNTFIVGICFNPIYSLFISLSYRACCWNRGVPFLWGALEL